MEFSMLEARERERDKVGFLLLPRSWKIGFNTFPIVRLIYINIQSREWRIYQASIERSEKLRVIRNSISMSHELYTYFVASRPRFFDRWNRCCYRISTSIQRIDRGNHHISPNTRVSRSFSSRHALIPAIYFEKGHEVEHRGLCYMKPTSDYFRNGSAILQSLRSFV